MPVWVEERQEFYNGCLMIFNIGQDNIYQFPKEYYEELRAKVADAHADGYIVIWAFDGNTGPFPIPDDFDNIESMDHVRMMFDVCGRKDSDFALLPEYRMKEFQVIKETMSTHPDFHWKGKFLLGGSCSIAGQKVLMPISEV